MTEYDISDVKCPHCGEKEVRAQVFMGVIIQFVCMKCDKQVSRKAVNVPESVLAVEPSQ